METQAQDRLANYDFVATVLWIGFVLAISFMEAPLRFQAESITIPIALEVGRLVFHALNGCEILLAIWILVCQFRHPASRKSRRLLLISLAILISQTLLLFLILDPRTNAIIANEPVPKSYHHTVYIVLEAIKLIALAFLAHSQIQDFKNHLTRSF